MQLNQQRRCTSSLLLLKRLLTGSRDDLKSPNTAVACAQRCWRG